MSCSVSGCVREVKSRGWCGTHYEFQRRHDGRLQPAEKPCCECGAPFRPRAHNALFCNRTCFLKSNRRMSKYRLTKADFDNMLANQGGCCWICRTTQPAGAHDEWAIDHDHETGAVRGILCSACNTGLGLFRDNPATLERARHYIFAAARNGGRTAWWSAA